MDQIVGVIRRVISEPGIAEPETMECNEGEPSSVVHQKASDLGAFTADYSSRPPAVVEMDETVNLDVGRKASTSSSLSDINDAVEQIQRSDLQMTADSSVSSFRTSRDGSGNWGWFEDVHDQRLSKKVKNRMATQVIPSNSSEDAAAMAVTAPTYVLEESLSSQKLWKNTAGTRPPQPVEERAFYEKMWAQNFEKSNVNYAMPPEVLTAASPISLSPFADGNFRTELSNYNISEETKQSDQADASLMDRFGARDREFGIRGLDQPLHPQHTVVNKKIQGFDSDDSLTVMVRGDNVFGTTVSKSFANSSDTGGPVQGIDAVNISIASYRVVDSMKHGKFAQYLVIYREGSIQDTIGVWKRYSDFKELSRKVTQQHESCVGVLANVSPLAMTEEADSEHLPNAITSWRLLKKRQRWYRCLDAGYLSLKVFLLERFLHDILFESSSPNLLREFVGDVVQHSDDNSSFNSENSGNPFF